MDKNERSHLRAPEDLYAFLESGAQTLPQSLRDVVAHGRHLTLYPGVMDGSTIDMPGWEQRKVALELRDGVIRLLDSAGPPRAFDPMTGCPVQATEEITPPPKTSSPR